MPLVKKSPLAKLLEKLLWSNKKSKRRLKSLHLLKLRPRRRRKRRRMLLQWRSNKRHNMLLMLLRRKC